MKPFRNMLKSTTILAALAVSLSAMAFAKTADYVVQNGKIYTSNAEQPWAEAIAIEGTDFVYVGENEGAREFIGEESIVADLRGKFMLPGIISTHEHPLMVMALASGLTLEYTEDAKQMLASVKEYVEKNPDAPMFSFGGSYEGRVEIYRQDMDKIISDKPFLMIAASGHGVWCNTKALEVAGVVKGKPDPIDSFQREKDGTPNGYLESSASTWSILTTRRHGGADECHDRPDPARTGDPTENGDAARLSLDQGDARRERGFHGARAPRQVH